MRLKMSMEMINFRLTLEVGRRYFGAGLCHKQGAGTLDDPSDVPASRDVRWGP